MSALFPWPSRVQRKAAIDRARSEREQSRRGAADAVAVTADLERMWRENHFAEILADQIMRRQA